MQFSMSQDAEGDGAWATVLDRMTGITFDVTMRSQKYFAGRIIEVDDIEVTFEKFDTNKGVWTDKEITVFIEDIDTIEYS